MVETEEEKLLWRDKGVRKCKINIYGSIGKEIKKLGRLCKNLES